MAKVISLRQATYEKLVVNAGRLQMMSGIPISLASTADVSIEFCDQALNKILVDKALSQRFREALQRNDRDAAIQMCITVMKPNAKPKYDW